MLPTGQRGIIIIHDHRPPVNTAKHCVGDVDAMRQRGMLEACGGIRGDARGDASGGLTIATIFAYSARAFDEQSLDHA